MRQFFLFFVFLLNIFFAPAQKKDSLLIQYFISKNLLTAEQEPRYKQLKQLFKESVVENLNQVKDSAARKKIGEIFETEGLPFYLENTSIKDTLSLLSCYLIPGIRKPLHFSDTYFEADTSVNKKNVTQQQLDDLLAFLKQLQLRDFTTAKSFNATAAAITNKEVLDSFFVIRSLQEAMASETYFSSKKMLPFINTLKKLNILSAENFEFLKAKAKQNEIEDIFTLFEKCEKATVIDLNQYGDLPENYMEPVHQKVAALMPTLAFTGFDVSIKKEKIQFDTGFSYKTVCSFVNAGKTYRQENFYSSSDYNKDGKPDNEWKLGDHFYNIFNKVLRDQQSAYRIHTMNFHGDHLQKSSGKIGFIALQKSQFDSLANSNFWGYFDLSHEKNDNGITSEKIQKALVLYSQIGLFTHLSKKETDSCINAVKTKEINYYSDILSSFKDLVFEIDMEYGVDDGQYKIITNQIAGISKHHFKPYHITDTYNYTNRNLFTYGFYLNGKKYATRLKQDDDWLDTAFWDLIENAMKEQDKQGRFYQIYPMDGMRIIYLTNKQYKILKEAGMLELSSDDITE
jgi:hypothetical protein